MTLFAVQHCAPDHPFRTMFPARIQFEFLVYSPDEHDLVARLKMDNKKCVVQSFCGLNIKDMIYKDPEAWRKNHKMILEDAAKLVNNLKKFKISPNDLHLGNMIWSESERNLYLIDQIPDIDEAPKNRDWYECFIKSIARLGDTRDNMDSWNLLHKFFTVGTDTFRADLNRNWTSQDLEDGNDDSSSRAEVEKKKVAPKKNPKTRRAINLEKKKKIQVVEMNSDSDDEKKKRTDEDDEEEEKVKKGRKPWTKIVVDDDVDDPITFSSKFVDPKKKIDMFKPTRVAPAPETIVVEKIVEKFVDRIVQVPYLMQKDKPMIPMLKNMTLEEYQTELKTILHVNCCEWKDFVCLDFKMWEKGRSISSKINCLEDIKGAYDFGVEMDLKAYQSANMWNSYQDFIWGKTERTMGEDGLRYLYGLYDPTKKFDMDDRDVKSRCSRGVLMIWLHTKGGRFYPQCEMNLGLKCNQITRQKLAVLVVRTGAWWGVKGEMNFSSPQERSRVSRHEWDDSQSEEEKDL